MYENWSDEKLLERSQYYGKMALEWKWKFAGLLPEINRRKLYEKKFTSIFHFAAQVGGMSHEQTRRMLGVGETVKEFPVLEGMFVNGEVSPNKMERIVSIATPENQEELAGKVKVLSQRAVETFVRDVKSVHVHGFEFGNDEKISQLELSDEVKKRLVELQEKGINVNNLLMELLDKHEQEKEEISENAKSGSRYIPMKVRKILKREYGTKCSIKNCGRKAQHNHHSQRSVAGYVHDPKYMAPFCKEHHQIAHSIDLKYHEARKRK